MNTAGYHYPLIKKTRRRDHEFILEDLELSFPKEQLESITNDWNEGMDVVEIAKKHKRVQDEILLTLFHQNRNKKLARRKAKSTLMVPGREQLRMQKGVEKQ